MDRDPQQRKGLGFISILTLIFVVAKLLGLVTWTWWLVFSPVLAWVALIIFIFLIALVVAALSD